MPWTIYHGGAGPGGSGIDLQGLGQLAYAKRQAAAQPNSALAAFGQGAGEGIAKGSENVWKFALQNFFDSKGDERKADLWGKREDALLNRQEQRDASMLERQIEVNAQEAMNKAREEQYDQINSGYHELYQGGQVPSAVAKQWDELTSDEMGLTSDSATRLPYAKRYEALTAIRQQKAQLFQSIPRPTESQKAASKMYSFAEIAPELQKRGFDPQSLSPAAQKALAGSIWTANRNGVPEMAFNPTEFEEKIAKIEAERLKAPVGPQNNPIQYVGAPGGEDLVGIAPPGTAFVRTKDGVKWIEPPKQPEQELPVGRDPEAYAKARKQAMDEWGTENPKGVTPDDRWVDKRARHILQQQQRTAEGSAEEEALFKILRMPENRRNAPAIRQTYDSVVGRALEQKLPPEVVAENDLEQMAEMLRQNPDLANNPEFDRTYRSLAWSLKALNANAQP